MRWRHSFFWLLLLLVTGEVVRAQTWTAPTAAPPTGNVPAPLNTSAVEQKKDGPLTIQGDLFVGGIVKGTGSRIQVSGTDTDYTLELGQHGNIAEAGNATGVLTTAQALTFESGSGLFEWWSRSGNTKQVSVGSAADVTARTLNLQQNWVLQSGASRFPVVPGSATDYTLELGRHDNITDAGEATGVLTAAQTLTLESASGGFQWWRRSTDSIYLSLNSQGEFRISGKLCLNTGSSSFNMTTDCRNTWPNTSSTSATETDTLATVTSRGANATTPSVPITISGKLTVDLDLYAEEYRQAGDVHVVTSKDYGHFPAGSIIPAGVVPIAADMVDDRRASDII
ncbi:hypothetical protein HY629_02750, partial [Candidatus Uhrbacteria bacterium]|nr:hypothetical protein [Candidatus Uhrbacteria bacterium]